MTIPDGVLKKGRAEGLGRLTAKIPNIQGYILLTDLEVSYLTSIPRGTLSRLRCAGQGPTYCKLGATVRYPLFDVLSYIEAGRCPSVRANMEALNAAQKKR